MNPPNMEQLFELPPIFYSMWTWIFAMGMGILVAIRSYFRGPQYLKKVKLRGKVVLVTGATSGIGQVVALDFAHRGGKVYLGCRDEKKGLEAQDFMRKDSRNPEVHYINLDLAKLKSVREFASEFKKRESQLDILVNNAGVMCCPRSITEDGFESQFASNYLGHYLLTRLLLPVIQAEASAKPRILCFSAPAYRLSPPLPIGGSQGDSSGDTDVTQDIPSVTGDPKADSEVRQRPGKGAKGEGQVEGQSDGQSEGQSEGAEKPLTPVEKARQEAEAQQAATKRERELASAAYAQSKLAMMLFVRRLAQLLEGSKVTVNAVHPGVCNTEIHRYMDFRQPSFLSSMMKPFIWFFMKTAVDGAQVPIFMAVDDSVEDVSGKYYVDMQPVEISDQAADDKMAELLWDKSSKWVGLPSEEEILKQ